MFEKFLNYIKGVINKMFSNNAINQAVGVKVAVSDKMVAAVDLWEKIYTNQAKWINKDVPSLNLGASISNEFTRLTTLEFKSEITGSKRADFLNNEYQKALKKLNEHLEEGNAVGGLILKPFVKENKICIDFVTASNFYPTEFNSDNDVTACVFVSQIKKGKVIYTRLEYHKFFEKADENGANYLIKNVCYMSENNNSLGKPVNLSSVDEWANIQEETAIKNVDRPLFAYYKPPIANNIDTDSPLGVSVYSRATDLIEQADKQFGRILWEYEASEKAIYIDELATRPTADGSFNAAHLRSRLYKKVNTNDDFFKDYSPEIRDEELWRGLNKTLQRIEFNVGLAYGTLSEPNTVDKTATEIKSSKQRSYATVSKMQENLQHCLENLIYSIDVMASLYSLAPLGTYETSYNWDDSLIVDTEKEQVLQMQEVNAGLRSKVDYIAFRNGLTIEQAQEKLNEINAEKEFNKNLFMDIPNEE